MKHKKLIRLAEFFIVGLIMGIGEDLLAIKLSTSAPITGDTIIIAFLVALPFAVFSELVVDHPSFKEKFLKKRKKDA